MLASGIICSIVWMMGLGSLHAFICGLRARSIIKASDAQSNALATKPTPSIQPYLWTHLTMAEEI
jgi:hypothetical protein